MAREAAALQRDLQQQAAIDAEEQDEIAVLELVDWWRSLAVAPPDLEVYRRGLSIRSFDEHVKRPPPPLEPRIPPPEEPRLHLRSAESELGQAIDSRVRERMKWRHAWISSAFVVGGMCIAGTVARVTNGASGSLVAAATIGGASFWLVSLAINARAVRATKIKEFLEAWPSVESKLREEQQAQFGALTEDHQRRVEEAQRSFQSELSSYRAAMSELEGEWNRKERLRIALLEQLLAGDQDTSTSVLTEAFEAIDFPFETNVSFAVSSDGRTIRLLVDLPELEDAIPESRTKALKNGTTKLVRRTRTERLGYYARLVIGLGIALATHAFCVLPAARLVSVAGYTQRRTRGKGTLEDQFVYDLDIAREDAEAMDVEAISPLDLLSQVECRVDFDASGNLRKISAPDWAGEVMLEDTTT